MLSRAFLRGVSIGVLIILVLGVLIVAFFSGCASPKPTEHYPYPKMLDPVTHQVPHVIL